MIFQIDFENDAPSRDSVNLIFSEESRTEEINLKLEQAQTPPVHTSSNQLAPETLSQLEADELFDVIDFTGSNNVNEQDIESSIEDGE